MNDEWTPAIVDDPTPPEPDAAVLARVIGRGRQRLLRRRAIYGAIAASVAIVLVGSGVAVAQRRNAGTDVAVHPTTIPATAGTVREADAGGIHFTLTLLTPVVRTGGNVSMQLHEENRADYAAARAVCSFNIVVLPADTKEHGIMPGECPQVGALIEPKAAFDAYSSATAPETPGLYGVVVEPLYHDAFPPSLIQEPFPLKVVDAGSTSPITPATTPNASEPLVGPTPTATISVPPEKPRTPQLGDFSGTLTVDRNTTAVPYGVNVDLNVRNVSDHVVDPNTVAIVCARDLGPDGHTTQPLRSNENLFFLVSPILRPGESSARSGRFDPTAADVGTVTCGAAIVAFDHGSPDSSLTTLGLLTGIPTVSFTVTPAAPPATPQTPTTAASGETTTTATAGP